MTYITEKDNNWHDPQKELPSSTIKVEFMDKRGIIHSGGIFVDMSGHFPYIGNNTWSSFDIIIKWRFI